MASLCLFAYSSLLQVTLSLLYCVPVPSLTSTASDLRLLISGALVCTYGGWQVRNSVCVPSNVFPVIRVAAKCPVQLAMRARMGSALAALALPCVD